MFVSSSAMVASSSAKADDPTGTWDVAFRMSRRSDYRMLRLRGA
jgi:hypothetical protein